MAENEGLIKLIDEEEGIVVLEEPNGEENRYEIVLVLDVDDDTYLIIVPEDDDVEEGFALKVVENEEGDTFYEPVVDEEELSKIEEELAKEDQ
ncbi:uncharacterized protein DUF1292 [Orenia metallireducens]|uniref:Uncharacterized protein n=1 Tax=Orenia metallireducens TaxID=1413210 RepID=A0A285I8W5_9FIRM|nr:DUF1292 domain-containing protein [Orenia metallireducens]PRX21681.1 uncharacterized protein DUF1292 [Orenia metallireducens]SNY44343.1 Protein of unknown function [Orenia metallireducens]